jgi:hypothetical protein
MIYEESIEGVPVLEVESPSIEGVPVSEVESPVSADNLWLPLVTRCALMTSGHP